MSRTAKLLKDFGSERVASQRLYLLSTGEHVLVSAADVFGTPETYIFACDADGNVTDWCEREGSFRGAINHERALRNAGYEPEPS